MTLPHGKKQPTDDDVSLHRAMQICIALWQRVHIEFSSLHHKRRLHEFSLWIQYRTHCPCVPFSRCPAVALRLKGADDRPLFLSTTAASVWWCRTVLPDSIASRSFFIPHVSRFLRHGTLEFFSKEPFLGMASLKSSLVNSRAWWALWGRNSRREGRSAYPI